MSDRTHLVISVQGKRGAGKTMLGSKVIIPALEAAGATIEKQTDVNKGLFLSVSLPLGALDKLVVAVPDEAEVAEAPPRVGFGNFAEVARLVAAYKALKPYADASTDMAGTVARMSLPKDLQNEVQPDALIACLRQDAVRGMEKIKAQLESLGFDISAAD